MDNKKQLLQDLDDSYKIFRSVIERIIDSSGMNEKSLWNNIKTDYSFKNFNIEPDSFANNIFEDPEHSKKPLTEPENNRHKRFIVKDLGSEIHGIEQIEGVAYLQRKLVKAIISVIAPILTYNEINTILDSQTILLMSNKLIVKVEEYNSLSEGYKNRYFDEIFTSKDQIKFKFWNNFGETIRFRGKVRPGGTPKFINAIESNFKIKILEA